ncbi:MAG: BON domain-containing protein [Nibricoccus sp.]
MKLFIFLLGAAAGAYGFYYYQTRNVETQPKKDAAHSSTTGTGETSPSFSDRVKEDAKSAKDTVGKELEHAGQVVKTKAVEVGATVSSAASNARIVGTIKAKFALDNELKARAINVDCDNGHVTLNGTVATTALIDKAVRMALETDGVTKVQSMLTVTAER